MNNRFLAEANIPDPQDPLKNYFCAVTVMRDLQVPQFDRVVAVEFKVPLDEEPLIPALTAIATEFFGTFCDDILQVNDAELRQKSGQNFTEPSRALKALRKAVLKYFKNTEQFARYEKAVQTIICRCRNVSDQELRTAIAKGMTTLDDLRNYTGATTGCGTCLDLVEKILKV